MNTANCKEKLIEVTIGLINKHNGDVEKVTVREITASSDVSVGLINYHFGNKNNLITVCTQRIISQVISAFKPDMDAGKGLGSYEAGKARLKLAACQVFYFLFTNPSISKISILNDYSSYGNETNSWASIEGFSRIIGDAIESKEKKEKISFYLVNSMQIAFLKSLTERCYLGYDFSIGTDRKRFIEELIDTLM
ncbi:MAG: TetR/AcrR family transcriptional regulator [Candidatus Coproplasma sp.]